MVLAANLGFPRIGMRRQLKFALERYWSGEFDDDELLDEARRLRVQATRLQEATGMDFIPSNDFSLYDHVLDTCCMVGAIPERFKWNHQSVNLTTYFLMARGAVKQPGGASRIVETPAMEMTKWFNTNYHFIVPELESNTRFHLASRKFLHEFEEAREEGITTRPVLLGPVTFLQLAKGRGQTHHFDLLEPLLSAYVDALGLLLEAGATWIQFDEPCLATDLDNRALRAIQIAYERLSEAGAKIMLTSYFGELGNNLDLALHLPVDGIHLDLVDGKDDLAKALIMFPNHMHFSAGVIDGRNVWRSDLTEIANLLEDIGERVGPDKLIVAPSCSLMHLPIDVEIEDGINPDVKPWLAFAQQKLEEVSLLTDALCCGRKEVELVFARRHAVIEDRKRSSLTKNTEVQRRLHQTTEEMANRCSPYEQRRYAQAKQFNLPQLPTTTIGSFPQTPTIRKARKSLHRGDITYEVYEQEMCREIEHNITIQEQLGLDVFVHGEPERTDMVEYFAEHLMGIAVTKHGWVQSYGSRCVKPPVIYGDVYRREPISTGWISYAQSLTEKPVKGMLTGPVTMLQWSFVRNDQPRELTCKQLALAIRDEVKDLEAAGIKLIQIDEPAIREGLPLKRQAWKRQLDWYVECFKLASCCVRDDTQIHTHMCYSEFGEIVDSIARLDADVLSIEASRSKMDLLTSLADYKYPNEIGPGVYDIHSPRLPTEEEIGSLISKALHVIPAERLWINPDCGLKTRSWAEIIPALMAMVHAAKRLRLAIYESKQFKHVDLMQ